MTQLKEILKDLKEGRPLELEDYENAFGVATWRQLWFNNGAWVLETLNCTSSYWLGLGTCACNSHPTYDSQEITREEALRLIKEYIQKKEEEENRRQQEIEFLDNLINSL